MKRGTRVTVRSSPGYVIRTLEAGLVQKFGKYIEVMFDNGRVSTYQAGEVRKLKK